MKVIKRGIPPDKQTFRAVCDVCKSHLEFARNEGKYHSDWRDGDYIEIKCPVCKKVISVNIP